MNNEVKKKIDNYVQSHEVCLFMKGTPEGPQCGFSSRASQLLISCGKPFSFVDILTNPEIRTTLPSVSDWPTFPQLFINGELIGGSDIMNEMFDSGDLQKAINQVEIPES